MKNLTQLNVMMNALRSSRKFALTLLLMCAMLCVTELAQAQLIRSKEKLASNPEPTSEQKKAEASRRRNELIDNYYLEYNDGNFNDSDYGFFASEQFVFDNLGVLKRMYTIPDIYFDLDQSEISASAFSVLDRLASLLAQERDLGVAITAHCDTRIAAYNNVLSLKRANAARLYLIDAGISPERVIVEMHGRRSIKNPCTDNPGCSIEEQQVNRRTEFNIIYNNLNLAHLHGFDE